MADDATSASAAEEVRAGNSVRPAGGNGVMGTLAVFGRRAIRSRFHSLNHANTEYPRMHRMLEYGASLLRTRGVTIFNCSPVSDLAGFEKISYDYAISL